LLLATVQWHCNELEAVLLTSDQLDESAAADEIQRSGKAISAWILLTQAGIARPQAIEQHDDSDDDAQDAASNISEARSIFQVVLAADPSHIDVSLGNHTFTMQFHCNISLPSPCPWTPQQNQSTGCALYLAP